MEKVTLAFIGRKLEDGIIALFKNTNFPKISQHEALALAYTASTPVRGAGMHEYQLVKSDVRKLDEPLQAFTDRRVEMVASNRKADHYVLAFYQKKRIIHVEAYAFEEIQPAIKKITNYLFFGIDPEEFKANK